jgi:environmental stress-induced protein Ves
MVVAAFILSIVSIVIAAGGACAAWVAAVNQRRQADAAERANQLAIYGKDLPVLVQQELMKALVTQSHEKCWIKPRRWRRDPQEDTGPAPRADTSEQQGTDDGE